MLALTNEVKQALAKNQPVVALETTIISHGMPYPENLETAIKLEEIIRQNGATPATIGLMDGQIKIGLTQEEKEVFAKSTEVEKVSRRDFAYVLATGKIGATTVAGTMIAAKMAGIQVFATGGIGGVHRGGETTWDVSADLFELAHTDVAVVCAGVKSILDIGRTLEYLETHGVPVVGYQCDQFPSFYSRESGHSVDFRINSPEEVAKFLDTKWRLGLQGGAIIANPVPEEEEIPCEEMEEIIVRALKIADRQRVSGKKVTPFLLKQIAEMTNGKSLATNIALVKHNAEVAAQVAVALKKLDKQDQ
jgi:pseudouridine-5'-phosphate glycosidase